MEILSGLFFDETSLYFHTEGCDCGVPIVVPLSKVFGVLYIIGRVHGSLVLGRCRKFNPFDLLAIRLGQSLETLSKSCRNL